MWVVDTQTSAIRRLPNLRPSDLEWRPGTDQLAIAGDVGPNRSAPTVSTPITIYSVSTGELHQLGSAEAAHLTWSPDGSTLAYTAARKARPGSGSSTPTAPTNDCSWPTRARGPYTASVPCGPRLVIASPIYVESGAAKRARSSS